jgi:hypothetical protein
LPVAEPFKFLNFSASGERGKSAMLQCFCEVRVLLWLISMSNRLCEESLPTYTGSKGQVMKSSDTHGFDVPHIKSGSLC